MRRLHNSHVYIYISVVPKYICRGIYCGRSSVDLAGCLCGLFPPSCEAKVEMPGNIEQLLHEAL